MRSRKVEVGAEPMKRGLFGKSLPAVPRHFAGEFEYFF